MSENIVILGAGVIGLSTAFYLSSTTSPGSIHLIDPSPQLFASCSGLAAGFLAKDWFGSSLAALGALSFEEHARLADEHGGREKWGYAQSRGLSYKPGAGGVKMGWNRLEGVDGILREEEEENAEFPAWLKRVGGDAIERLGKHGTLAQMDPLRFCQFLLKTCITRGVQLHHPSRAHSIVRNPEGELSSIRIRNLDTDAEINLPCSRILIAAGAWSSGVYTTLFPNSKLRLPISSLAGHSLVVKSPKWSKEHEIQGCHAIFTTHIEGFSPEIFSRIGEEIYIGGLNSSSILLPDLATESKVDAKSMGVLKESAQRFLGNNEDPKQLQILREGLCFRPMTSKGVPILARIPDEKLGEINTRGGGHGGIFLASGHGPWGISNSLGTGKIMAEMMLGKSTSVDISGLGL